MTCLRSTPPGCVSSSGCVDKFGCPEGVCPDFQIKRHDTVPAFKVLIEDENGPMDLTGLVLEANMWASAKLKTAITATDTTLQLADNIGFEQILVNDIIVPQRVRGTENMRVIGFDESTYKVEVERGYNGTTASAWNRGTPLKIMRVVNAAALTEMIYADEQQADGTCLKQQLVESSWFMNGFLMTHVLPAVIGLSLN